MKKVGSTLKKVRENRQNNMESLINVISMYDLRDLLNSYMIGLTIEGKNDEYYEVILEKASQVMEAVDIKVRSKYESIYR